MKRLVVALVLLAAGTGSVLAEQYYKWRDADGVWRYTAGPPPAGIDGSRVYVSGGPKRSADAAAAEAREAADDAPRETDEVQGEQPAQPLANSAEAIKARRDAACTNARQRLDVLANNAAVEWDRDGDGTAERLDPAEQAKEVEKAGNDIRIYCPRS